MSEIAFLLASFSLYSGTMNFRRPLTAADAQRCISARPHLFPPPHTAEDEGGRTSRPSCLRGEGLFFSGCASAALILLAFVIGCSVPPAKVNVRLPPENRLSQTGIASWYGPGFHGKATASGDIYNQSDLTAAHQTLPLGTAVMVTNLENGNSTRVTINDRGPFAKGRIIDLSYAAAQSIDMVDPGTALVRVDVIDSPTRIQTIRPSLDYTLQAGSFSQLENAQQLRDRLAKSFSDVTIAPQRFKDVTYYRVQMGTFSDRVVAEEQARQVIQSGYSVIIMEK